MATRQSAWHPLARFLLEMNNLDHVGIALHIPAISQALHPAVIQIKRHVTETVRIFTMRKRHHVHIPLEVRMVAKIGLSVALASCLGLLLVLLQLSDDTASGYGQIVGAFGLARDSLGPAMLAFGLALVGFAGLSAWLFALYASFRIAGPLYRISRELELQVDHPLKAPMPIRATDCLQREWKAFEASIAALRTQHEELRQALGEAENALGTPTETVDPALLALALARLKNAQQRVRL